MRRAVVVVVFSVAAGCAAQQPPPTQVVAGTHRYQLVPSPAIPFEKAEAEAAAMHGHLARLETTGYGLEMKTLHDAVFGPAVRADKWYWIGASRPNPEGNGVDGWRWNDGSDVPTSITSTWTIDLMEGRVAEGACVSLDRDMIRVGDYAATNPTGIVDGYVVELE